MSQVNLLPPEILQRQKLRQKTVLVGIIGGAVILLIIAFYFFQTFNLSGVNNDLAAQEQTNSQIQTQISALSQYGDQQAELQKKQKLETTVYQGEISWSGVLGDVSKIMPPDAVLSAFTAQEALPSAAAGGVPAPAAAPVAPTAGAAPPGELVGTLNFTVSAAGIDTVTSFLAQLGEVRGWANPYTTSVTESSPRSGNYNFAATADMTKEVLTPRGRGEAESP